MYQTFSCVLQVTGGNNRMHKIKKEWRSCFVYLVFHLYKTRRILIRLNKYMICSEKNHSENKVTSNVKS